MAHIDILSVAAASMHETNFIKGKVCFSTLNYHDRPILDPELRNQTTHTCELTKLCRIPPSRNQPGFKPRQRGDVAALAQSASQPN